MISFVKGELEEVLDNGIIVECNGIGYNINFASMRYSQLPSVGSVVKIYTYMNVREDAIQLFGFLTREEVDLFRLLITVSGIGPKGAQSILASMDIEDLRFAILSGDAKSISKVPGIGAKTASKLILELKDKIQITAPAEDGGTPKKNKRSEAVEDTLLVLEQFGFSATEAMKAINSVENASELDSKTLVKKALAYFKM